MATDKQLTIVIVSQEKKIEQTVASQVTLMTAAGEVTILPDHIPLMSRLTPGIMRYVSDEDTHEMVISNGFVDVNPDNVVTIMVDSATPARDVSEQEARAAIEAARKTMIESSDRRELILAEASLKQAMLELKIAQKTKKAKI